MKPRNTGEANGNAILTWAKVDEIKYELSLPWYYGRNAAVARKHNVSPETICAIGKGRRWASRPHGQSSD